MPSFGEFLFGSKGKVKKADTLTPEQQQLISLISEGLTTGKGSLGSLFGDFDKGAFEEGVTKPALQNFKESVLPLLNEKFIAGNQVLGSGMRRGQLQAANKLQSDLAGLMYQAQQQQQQNKLAGLQTALGTKAFENIYKPGTKGAVQGFVEGVGQGIGQAAGGAVAG